MKIPLSDALTGVVIVVHVEHLQACDTVDDRVIQGVSVSGAGLAEE